MSDLKLFNSLNPKEKVLEENLFYKKIAEAVEPIIQTPVSRAFKPVLWNSLIEEINDAIENDATNSFVEQMKEDPSVYLFGVVVKFSSPVSENILYMVRVAMAFQRDENNIIVSRGQLLVDVVVQSVTRTSAQELHSFSQKDMLSRYRTKGDMVLDKISVSLIDVRSLDAVYKHLLLLVKDFVVRVDGEETQSPFYMINDQDVAVVSMKKFDSKSSEAAVSITAGFEAGTEEALLTSNFYGTCTTSTNDPNGNLQVMHTTANVQHILSARVQK